MAYKCRHSKAYHSLKATLYNCSQNTNLITRMGHIRGFESRRITSTEDDFRVWGADSFRSENGLNNNSNGGRREGWNTNNNIRGSVEGWNSYNNGGGSRFSQQTTTQIEQMWGSGLVRELNQGRSER